MKTISLEQEINPWEAQAARFDFAAQKLNLDEGLMKVLRYPTREIILHMVAVEQRYALQTKYAIDRTDADPMRIADNRLPSLTPPSVRIQSCG